MVREGYMDVFYQMYKYGNGLMKNAYNNCVEGIEVISILCEYSCRN